MKILLILLITSVMMIGLVTATSYTPTTETNCVQINATHKRCTISIKDNQLDSDGKRLTEVSDLTWTGESYNLSYRNKYWVEIKPFAIANGHYWDVPKLRQTFPNMNIRERINKRTYDHKFALNLEMSQNIVDSINYFGFELVGSNLNWNDVKKRDSSSVIIKDKVVINFRDLIDSNYDITFFNKTRLLIGNISANYKNGSIDLDPTVELDYNDIQIDYVNELLGRPTKYGFQMRWGITDVPDGASSIDNATICFFEDCTGGFCSFKPDDDLNLSRVTNLTWILADWDEVDLANITTTTWFNSTGGSTLNNGDWWCANVTDNFRFNYNQGYDNLSLRFTDPDALSEPEGASVDDQLLDFGGLKLVNFRSKSNSDVATRPYMNITYTAELNAPVITLYSPSNESIINATKEKETTFTCEVNDSTETDYVEFWSDFRNGTWQLEQTDNTNNVSVHNYTFGPYNLSNWFDGTMKFTTNTYDGGLAGNGTNFFTTTFNSPDETRVLDLTGNIVDNWSNPDDYIGDLDVNGTNIVYVDLISKKLYLSNMTGGDVSSCTFSFTGNPYGVAFDDDNVTVWVVFETTDEKIYHTYTNCTEIKNYSLSNGNPEFLTIANNVAWYHDPFQTPNEIRTVNLSDGTSVETIVDYRTILDLGSDDLSGLWIDKTDSFSETIYTRTNSPVGLNRLRRLLNTTDHLWDCYACDVFNNCGWSSNGNFTFDVRNVSAECWTYDSINKLLSIPEGCLFSLGQNEIFTI